MAANLLFSPNISQTVSITAGTVAAAVALVVTGRGTAFSLRIKNIDASNVVYVSYGTSSAAAAAAATIPSGANGGALPIGAGETAGITIPASATHVGAISSAGSPVVYFTPGEGL
jgi:hypothetical protein